MIGKFTYKIALSIIGFFLCVSTTMADETLSRAQIEKLLIGNSMNFREIVSDEGKKYNGSMSWKANRTMTGRIRSIGTGEGTWRTESSKYCRTLKMTHYLGFSLGSNTKCLTIKQVGNEYYFINQKNETVAIGTLVK